MTASFVHEALFYRDTGDYLAGTVPFVETALARREPVLVAVPRARIDLLTAALEGRAASVRFVDMTRAGRNPGKIIPWVLHAFLEEHAGAPVRIIGEPIWAGRSTDEYPACVQHEALINVAFAGMVASPVSSVFPGMGNQVLIICFVVVVIGGIGSLKGALVASLLIGFTDTFGKVLAPELAGVAVYLLMAVVLLFRPAGLFGRSSR